MSEPAPNRDYPEVLEDLAAKLAALFVNEQIERDRALELAFSVTELIRGEWGGATVYVPIGVSYNTRKLALDIAGRWNRHNTRELCRELGISERRLAQLYRIGRALKMAETQLRLDLIDDQPAP